MTDELKPYYWLPEITTTGEKPRCQNCEHFSECGHRDYLCGDWSEELNRQMEFRYDR